MTTLKTDRNGQSYGGPRTFRDAERLIDEGADCFEVARKIADAGYTRTADRVRRHYAGRSMVAGCQVQHDPSRNGHAWRFVDMTAARMADAAEEIAAEIIDGRNTSCSRFVSTSGDHFRWEEWSQ